MSSTAAPPGEQIAVTAVAHTLVSLLWYRVTGV